MHVITLGFKNPLVCKVFLPLKCSHSKPHSNGNPVLAIRKGTSSSSWLSSRAWSQLSACELIYVPACVSVCQLACVPRQVRFSSLWSVCLCFCVGLLSSLPLIRTRHINLNIDYRLHACIVCCMYVYVYIGMCEGGF